MSDRPKRRCRAVALRYAPNQRSEVVPCSRRATHGPDIDGNPRWCWQHDPERMRMRIRELVDRHAAAREAGRKEAIDG